MKTLTHTQLTHQLIHFLNNQASRKAMIDLQQHTHGLVKWLALTFSAIALFGAVAVSAKDLPGSSPTSYGVSSTGAFQYQIPIVIPQGTNGVQPNLSLSFSSDRRNGPLGVGWGLGGLSSITRCGKTFATNGIKGGVLHNANDRYCLNGKQLIVVSGVYSGVNSEYRTEIDEFSKIVASSSARRNANNGGTAPTSWTVYRKDGLIYKYGTSSDSQFVLAGTTSIHAWKLSRVSDRNGNHYDVSYNTADGLPEKIDYTANSGLSADKQVDFIYGTRTDIRNRYVTGKKITNNRRLTEIKVTKNNTQIRKYTLAYQYAQVSKKSLITSVTECGRNNACMPPIQISWKTDTKGFRTATLAKEKAREHMIEHYTYQSHLGSGQTEKAVKEINRGAWADVNGDGLVDQIIAYQPQTGSPVYKTYLKTASGWSANQTNWQLPRPLLSYENDIVNNYTARFAPDVINMGQLVDVNGDGLVDVVYSYRLDTDRRQYMNVNCGTAPVVCVKETHLNTGNGWALSTAYKPVEFIYDYWNLNSHTFAGKANLTQTGRFVDINGDGLVDWMTSYHRAHQPWNSTRKTFLNTGNGWALNSNYAPPSYFIEYHNSKLTWNRGELVDVNGDGLLDWIEAYKAPYPTSPATLAAWINTGTGWNRNDAYKLPEHIYEANGSWNSTIKKGRFVDVNGDGLADWVRSVTTYTAGVSERLTRLNTGKGWVVSSQYQTPFVHLDYSRTGNYDGGDKNKPRVPWPVLTSGNYMDINRDGLVDYSESYKDIFGVEHKNTWLNNGSTWVKDNSYNTGWIYFDYSGRDKAKIGYGNFIDINSDGSQDWIRSRSGLIASRINKLNKTDMVSQITSTMGVEVKPTFLPLTANDQIYTKIPTDGNNNPIAPQSNSYYIEAPICVVSKLETSRADGLGFNAATYSYAGAQVHRRGRGYLGFQQRTITDVTKDITVYQEYKQGFPFTGMLSKTMTMSGDTVLSASTSTPTYRRLNNNKTWFPYISSSLSTKAELNGGDTYQSAYQTATYDNYGNMLTSLSRTGADVGGNQGQTNITATYYPHDTSNWLIAQVKDQTTTVSAPGKPNITRFTDYTYDSVGRLHTTTREPNTSEPNIKLTTTYGYDDYGNVETETLSAPNENDRVNTIGYDAQHRLPISLSNALNQSSSIVYHPHCDQPDTVTDANDLVTSYEYDDFCRQTQVTSPENIVSTTAFDTTGLSCMSCQTTPKFKTTTTTSGQAPITSYYNSYTQTLLSTTTGMLLENITQRTDYDRFGRVQRTSQPYFSTDNPVYTSYTYDDLNRVELTTLPYLDDSGQSATVSQIYSVDTNGRRFTTITDTKYRDKVSYANALGQIVEVKDANNKSLNYNFDAQGNLTLTTDSVGNNIIVGYDLLGRRTSLDDPDLGLSSFTYNAFSELKSQTDAKLQTIRMKYDDLGRMVERTVPGLPSESGGTSTWVYDTATNGIGALASVTGPNNYSQTHQYDNFGRPLSSTTVIKGQSYTQSLTFNDYGQLASRSYPNSGVDSNGNGIDFTVHYNYQSGYLSTITSGNSTDPNCIEHWRADKYDALGRVTQESLGKIITSTRAYDTAQGVLDNIQSIVTAGTNAGTTVQNLSYQYDAMNNLTSRNDALTNLNETFTYDNLDRLRFHYQNDVERTEVRYNDIGNITYKSDVGTYDYSGQGGPHALSRVDLPLGADTQDFEVNWEWDGQDLLKSLPNIHGQNFVYDANGNIEQSGDRWVWWTAFDKPTRMEKVDAQLNITSGSNFEYDADFNRIVKTKDDGEQTIYIGKDYERITDNDGTVHRYMIAAGSNTIQIERADNTGFDEPKYMLADHLGSTNVIVDASGNVVQKLTFDPWGMRTSNGDVGSVNAITNKGYTGHEMDDEVGMVNMNARIYDPYLGRFLSADPVLPDAYDMQQYNRYSYVGNNPLKYTDPTGYLEEVVVIGADITIPPSGGGPSGNGGSGPGAGGGESGVGPGQNGPANNPPKPSPTEPDPEKPEDTLEETGVEGETIPKPRPPQFNSSQHASHTSSYSVITLYGPPVTQFVEAEQEAAAEVESELEEVVVIGCKGGCGSRSNYSRTIASVAGISNFIGYGSTAGALYNVDSNGYWRSKGGYRPPTWWGNPSTGFRKDRFKAANGFKVLGKIAMVSSLAITANDLRNGKISRQKASFDAFFTVISPIFPLGTATSLSYLLIDSANGGNWTGGRINTGSCGWGDRRTMCNR